MPLEEGDKLTAKLAQANQPHRKSHGNLLSLALSSITACHREQDISPRIRRPQRQHKH